MKNIWQELEKPIYALAPMEDVTDTVFRRIVQDCGKPNLMFTEFTSCEGLDSEGRSEVIHRFEYKASERPLIAQIWGKTPDAYREATQIVVDKGFDGVDINFGCPVPKITKQGCCSALIEQPELAGEIIEAVQEVAAGKIPVSVKTRLGFSDVRTEAWSEFLLGFNLAALTMHGRIAKEMSKKAADWDEIGKVVGIRDRLAPETLIIGNGDILSLEQADRLIAKHKVDGVMIARGIFQNPWIFNRSVNIEDITPEERIDLCLKHIDMFLKEWGEDKNFAILKKFFKVYISEFPHSREFRNELMQADTPDETIQLLKDFRKKTL